jgi:hypothetical protein
MSSNRLLADAFVIAVVEMYLPSELFGFPCAVEFPAEPVVTDRTLSMSDAAIAI